MVQGCNLLLGDHGLGEDKKLELHVKGGAAGLGILVLVYWPDYWLPSLLRLDVRSRSGYARHPSDFVRPLEVLALAVDSLWKCFFLFNIYQSKK